MSTTPAAFSALVSSAALAVWQRGRAIIEHPVIKYMPVHAVIDPHEPVPSHKLLCTKHASVWPRVQAKVRIV